MNNSNWLISLKIKKDQFVFGMQARRNRKNTYFIIIFIALSLLIGLVILQIFGYDFGNSITQMFTTPFSNLLYKDFLTNFAILGVAALAFIIANKAGLFNIGINGQMMGAGLAFIAMAKNATWTNDNAPWGDAGIILTIIVAILAGAFVALVSGVLKTLFNINEVVSAILINWIVFFLTKYLIQATEGGINNADDTLISYQMPESMSLYDSSMFSGFVGALIIFFVVTLLVWFTFKFTTFGKQIKAVGLSKDASIYSGYKTKLLQLSAFAMSGAVAGLLAVIVYTGTYDRAIPLSSTNVLPTYGTDGIAIALIAFTNPIALVPITFFLAIIDTASAAAPPYPSSFGDMVIGLVMYGSAVFVLVYRYKPIRWFKAKLSRKVKYERSYWVRQYSDDNNIYINNVEQLLAIRKLNIFLETHKIVVNDTLSVLVKWYEKKKQTKRVVEKINFDYMLKKNELDKNHVKLFASFKKKIEDTNKEFVFVKDKGGK